MPTIKDIGASLTRAPGAIVSDGLRCQQRPFIDAHIGHLAVHLRCYFQRSGALDFAEGMSETAPSELALRPTITQLTVDNHSGDRRPGVHSYDDMMPEPHCHAARI